MEENNSNMSKRKLFLLPALLAALASISLTSCGETKTSSSPTTEDKTTTQETTTSEQPTTSETSVAPVATSITIDNKADFAKVGNRTADIKLSVTTNPAGVAWTAESNNTEVATIIGKFVHFVGAGDVTITVKSGDVSDTVSMSVADVKPVKKTCAEIRAYTAAPETAVFATITGKVLGASTASFIVDDGTGAVLVYVSLPKGYAIGDTVTVEGNIGAYRNVGQIVSTNFAIAKSTETITPSLTAPTEMSATAWNAQPSGYTNTAIKWVKIEGTYVRSGTYDNFTVDGSTKYTGQFASGYDATKWGIEASKNGLPITLEGFIVDIPSTGGGSVLISNLTWKEVKAITSITITDAIKSIGVGSKAQLSVSVNEGALAGATYALAEGADNTVATVSASGLVTGLKAGTVGVVATSTQDTKVVSAAYTVTIVDLPAIVDSTIETVVNADGVLSKLTDVIVKSIGTEKDGSVTKTGSMVVNVEGDEAKTLKIYGLTATNSSLSYVNEKWSYSNDKSFGTLNIAVGDKITIGGFYTAKYGNFSAYFISKYIPPTEYDVTINAVTNGSVSADVLKGVIDTKITLTIAADAGYYLTALTVNDVDVLANLVGNTLVVSMVADGLKVTATFASSEAFVKLSSVTAASTTSSDYLVKVVSLGYNNLFVTDGTAYAWVYQKNIHTLYSVGDIIKLSATITGEYSSALEFVPTAIVKTVAPIDASSLTKVALTATLLDGYVATPAAMPVEVEFDGYIASKNGNTNFVGMEGTTNQLRLNSVAYTYLSNANVGDLIHVKGYLYGKAGTTAVFVNPSVDPIVTANTNSYNVTIEASTNGSVTADVATAIIGADVKLTVAPAEGYKLETLKVNGTDVASTVVENVATVKMVFGGLTVAATFVSSSAAVYGKLSFDFAALAVVSNSDFGTDKGGAASAPAYNTTSSEIRLYIPEGSVDGCSLFTKVATEKAIASLVINAKTKVKATLKVQVSEDGSTWTDDGVINTLTTSYADVSYTLTSTTAKFVKFVTTTTNTGTDQIMLKSLNLTLVA